MLSSIRDLQEDIVEWADSISPKRTPEAAFDKMLEEIEEWKSRPCDGHEAADVLIMLLDVCHLAGIDPVKAVHWKMRINRERSWEVQPDGTFKHTTNEQRHTGTAGHTASAGRKKVDYCPNCQKSIVSGAHFQRSIHCTCNLQVDGDSGRTSNQDGAGTRP